MSAELGRERLSQIDPLQQAPQGRALCGLGTAEALFRRASRGLQITAEHGRKSSLVAASRSIRLIPRAEWMDSALSFSPLALVSIPRNFSICPERWGLEKNLPRS